MGATSASGGRPAGPVRTRWLLAVAVLWAALFGGAYALGAGISTTRTTTITRSQPVTPRLAPGSPARSKTVSPRPPPVRVNPIVPMPPAPILKPYRLTAQDLEPTAAFVSSRPAVTHATAVVSSSAGIGTGPGGMGDGQVVLPTTTQAHPTR